MIRSIVVGVLAGLLGMVAGIAVIEQYGTAGWVLMVPVCVSIGVGVSELVDMVA